MSENVGLDLVEYTYCCMNLLDNVAHWIYYQCGDYSARPTQKCEYNLYDFIDAISSKIDYEYHLGKEFTENYLHKRMNIEEYDCIFDKIIRLLDRKEFAFVDANEECSDADFQAINGLMARFFEGFSNKKKNIIIAHIINSKVVDKENAKSLFCDAKTKKKIIDGKNKEISNNG